MRFGHRSRAHRDEAPTPVTPLAGAVSGRESPWAMELSCRYLFPFLALVDEKGLQQPFADFLQTWGVTRAELGQQDNWVSRSFREDLVEWLGQQVGEDELVRRTAALAYDPRALGFLYPLLRAVGSPTRAYRRLPETARNLNKTSSIRILKSGRRHVEVEYGVAKPELRERSSLICKIRMEQLAAAPRLWGLPRAAVESLTCQAEGDDACRYSIRWVDRPGIVGLALGTLSGAGAAALSGLGTSLGAVAVVLVGLLAGRIWDQRWAASEIRTFADEQRRALTDAARAAEERFEELQKAKAEVDIKVEERTRELRIATEKRVQTEKLAVLGTLAAGMAHEVSNPANAIINGLPRVKRELEKAGAPEKVVMMVDISIDCARRISSIVTDLLDLGRPERAGEQAWDPGKGLDASVRILNTRPNRVNIDRDYQFEGTIIGRPSALNQILLNLLDNAFRAVSDKPEGRVMLSTKAESDGLVVLVADTGDGVSADHREQVFNPFFTTRAVGSGTGLGLHFSRRVAEDHGGRLDLMPAEPGRGAAFRLWLPLDGAVSPAEARP